MLWSEMVARIKKKRLESLLGEIFSMMIDKAKILRARKLRNDK
jgi:hypothetical protein